MAAIVPAILAKDISSFEEEIKKVDGFVTKIQMDIVDGKFTEVETVMPDALLSIETAVEVEGHLMVDEPEEWIEKCVAAGMTAIYGQVERMSDKQKFIDSVVEAGLKVGLAFDVTTPLTGLDEWINMVDGVLLMSVPAGAQGQRFDDSVLDKIRKVRELSATVTIVIDGGLNEENIKQCIEIGGKRMEFAVGSEILNSGDAESSYRKLESIS